MNKTILLFLFAMFMVLSGCYTKKQAIRKFCHQTLNVKDSTVFNFKDSTVVSFNLKDSTRIIPGVTQEFNLENICDSLGRLKNISIKTHSGSSNVSIQSKGNALVINTNFDSVISYWREAYYKAQSTIKESQHQTHQEKQVIQLPAPPWFKTVPQWLWWWIFVASGHLLWHAFYYFKPFILKKP